MLWYRNRQVPGRQDTMLVADSGGAHVSKEPDVAKMDLIAADMAVAVWNGIVRDARRHMCPCGICDQYRLHIDLKNIRQMVVADYSRQDLLKMIGI